MNKWHNAKNELSATLICQCAAVIKKFRFTKIIFSFLKLKIKILGVL